MEYPFYKDFYKINKKEIKELISNYTPIIFHNIPDNLKKYQLKKYGDEFFIIKENFLESYLINNITDYFSETERIKCKFGNNISLYEYWEKNKDKIIMDSLKKYGEKDIFHLREMIYYQIRGCNNFRITVALTILKFFKVKTWLDISAGWGDRLLAAIFHKVKLYVSADPNLDLFPCYNSIINTFVPLSKQNNFIIYPNGFLEAPIDKFNFDIVFSSPPFFTLEKYSTHKENSITQFKNEKEWVDNFFWKSLIKAYNHLKKEGHMILYMGGSEYVMNKMFELSNFMKYKGVIYFYENKPKAIYVWQKIKDDKLKIINT
jgi:hypothetical protein